jgi:hypothetical protein
LNRAQAKGKLMEEELKLCPHCEGTAEVKAGRVSFGHGSGGDEAWIECGSCGTGSKRFDTYSDTIEVCIARAIAAWNRRSALAAPAQEVLAAPAKEGGQDTPAAVSAGDLYAVLRNMYWTDGKLAVIEVKDLRLGVQTYSGELLDAAIVRATTRGEA